jgi:hypothetical protein
LAGYCEDRSVNPRNLSVNRREFGFHNSPIGRGGTPGFSPINGQKPEPCPGNRRPASLV